MPYCGSSEAMKERYDGNLAQSRVVVGAEAGAPA